MDKCSKCGKEITSKYCPYCGGESISVVKQNSESSNSIINDKRKTQMQWQQNQTPLGNAMFSNTFNPNSLGYRVEEMKGGSRSIFTSLFMVVWGVGFSIGGFIAINNTEIWFSLLFIIPGVLAILYGLYNTILPIIKRIGASEIIGIVEGYTTDPNMTVNGMPCKTCYVLVNENGEQVLLGNKSFKTNEQYRVGSKVKLIKNGNYCKIVGEVNDSPIQTNNDGYVVL